ncbi:hypothetical protein [Brevundimonas sp.]|uniref:hypothetical protein n=1 Tax=Brevundimonas sp. TaxID=1871086 RepID=UPI00391C5281
MTRSLSIVAALALVGSCFAVTGAAASDSQSGTTYRLTARVPVACWVRPSGALLASPGVSGSVVEACNAPGGFTVSAQYRALGESETASLRYAGRVIQLSRSGEQILRRSNLATIRTVDYQFDDVELTAPLILSLTIQPI